MILFIDTSDYEQVRIALVDKTIIEHHFVNEQLSEKLLVEIKKFLSKQKIKLQQLRKIAVVVGPGGFSKIRTAVAVANALVFGLKIPLISVNKNNVPTDLVQLKSLRSQKVAQPVYDKQPNITFPKKSK